MHANQSSLEDALVDGVVELHQVHVAWVSRVPDGRNSNLRLVHVLLFQPSGIQHGLGGTLRLGLRDVAADFVEGGIFFIAAGSGRGQGATVKRESIGLETDVVKLHVPPLRAASSRGPRRRRGSSKPWEQHRQCLLLEQCSLGQFVYAQWYESIEVHRNFAAAV